MGPYLVKRPGSLLAITNPAYITGDGKGSENPVPVQESNQVVFFIDLNNPAGVFLKLLMYVEVTADGLNYFRELTWTEATVSGVTVRTLAEITYEVLAADWASGDLRLSLPVDVIGAAVRFSHAVQSSSGSISVPNLAVRALTGRV